MATYTLIPDTYHGGGDPDWNALADDPRFFGAIIKATEGVSYKWAQTWFKPQWPELRIAGGDRYGKTWLRGCYHYLIFRDDPGDQAEYFVNTIRDADSQVDLSQSCDIMPIVDVELGSKGSLNHDATRDQVLDVTSAFVEHVKQSTGCPVMLYGHQAMLQLQIADKMGCDGLWLPTYSKKMADPTAIGWDEEDVLLWQYTDGTHNYTEYPSSAPGLNSADISTVRGSAGDDLSALQCRAIDY